MFARLLPCLFVLLLGTPAAHAAETPQPIRVVASFSIIADMVKQIGGSEVEVQTLVGADEDAHDFQPTPDAAKTLANAEIIAINGLKFEGWMGRLIKASGTKAKLLVASAGVKARMMDDEVTHGHEHKKGESTPDPHAWQDLRNARFYLNNILGALSQARPALAPVFKERAQSYLATLLKLDEETRAALANVPTERRKVITSHDAFAYFGAAYDIQLLSPSGISTEAEPSAADVAKLITQIKDEGIKTLFIENMTDPRLIQQIAKDTGARVGGKLYADALSKEGGDAPTYLDMMRHNTRVIITSVQ